MATATARGRPPGISVVAEEPPGYGAEAQQARPQPALLRIVGIAIVGLAFSRRIGMRREASGVPALVVGLVDLEWQLIRIEWAGCRLGPDRRPGVGGRTVQLWKGYRPFIDGHARTSRTVAG